MVDHHDFLGILPFLFRDSIPFFAKMPSDVAALAFMAYLRGSVRIPEHLSFQTKFQTKPGSESLEATQQPQQKKRQKELPRARIDV